MEKNPSLGFSTIGCPDASIAKVNELARRHGLQFLELRALEGTLDLPRYFQSHAVPAGGAEVRVIGTSLRLLNADDKDLDEFYAQAELASRLHVPYLRIFGAGSGTLADAVTPAQLAAGAALVEKVRGHLQKQGWPGELLLETHDVLSSSERCLALNARLAVPLRFLWDSHHTWRLGGEAPERTWRELGPRIAHVHYKDSVVAPTASGFRYVAPGQGEYPTAELRTLLAAAGYGGGISFEWEKLWHPELAEIDDVLGGFAALFGER